MIELGSTTRSRQLKPARNDMHLRQRQQGKARLRLWAVLLCVVLLGVAGIGGWQAARGQAAAAPYLRLLDVSDANYPQLTVRLDARNENGAPAGNLNDGNFAVQIGGVALESFAAQQDTSVGLDVVFVLDRSTTQANWTQTQAIVAAALGLLRDQDRVALTVFADDVELVQGFTGDFAATQTALAAVGPAGEFSASLPAIVDAIERLVALGSERGVVIVVADAPDNISQVSVAQVVNAANSAEMSIAIASYGPGQNVASYDQIVAATGGRRAGAAAIDDLQQPIVQWLNTYLPAWLIELDAPIVADNQSYPLALTYTTAAGSTTATGSFVAQVREVDVAWRNLAPNQPLAGTVELQVEASAPAPPAQVAYRVDGLAVGASAASESFLWDTTTVDPGARVLEATVTDSAGNVGVASIPVQIIRSAPRLAILEVDAQSFPRVDIYVDAFALNGLPLVGLDANAFAVREAGAPVAQSGLVVTADTSRPQGIVLILDRSVSVADWAQLRTAANMLIDALRPGDEIAIYGFAQDVTLIQPVTANHGAAKAALATVDALPTPAGDDAPADNALYSALLDAVNLAGVVEHSRVAVIAVTDGPDDTGTLSVGQLTDLLLGQETPIHLLTVGGAESSVLASIAELTGGSAAAVNNASDVRGAWQTLATLLQSGYRITYVSGLAADGSTHELSVTLIAQGQQTAATGALTTVSGEVSVRVPGVEAGATVAGEVNLTAQVDAPGAVVSVVYRVNGEVLAEVDSPATTILWNSDTVTPGPYTLAVEATDAVGNRGQTSVDLVVVAPLVLEIPFDEEPVAIGQRVDLAIGVDSFFGGVRVEAAVDGVVVATDDGPPYQISFGTSDLTPGERVLLIVAQDRAGYQAVRQVNLTLVAAQDPAAGVAAGGGDNGAAAANGAAVGEGTGEGVVAGLLGSVNFGQLLRWLGIIAVVAVLLGFLAWLLALVGRSRRERKLTPMRMTLTNSGNAQTAYLLRGEDESRVLSFEFSLNGHPLGLPPVARLEPSAAPVAATGQSAYAPTPVQAGPAQQAAGQPSEYGNGYGDGYGDEYGEGVDGGGQGGGFAQIGGRVQEAGMVGQILASILTSVAMFLPRNLSRPVRQVAMTLRRGTMLTRRVGMVQRQVGRLNKTRTGAQLVEGTQQGAAQVGEFVTSDATRAAVYGAGQSAQGAAVGMAGATVAGAQRGATRLQSLTGSLGQAGSAAAGAATGMVNTARGALTGASNRQWVYVPTLGPGETVTIDILVGGVGANAATRHHPFRLISRALDDESGTPVVEEGSVRIQGAPWWRRNLWTLLGVLLALVAVLAALIWLF